MHSTQSPFPGSRHIHFCGDQLCFVLKTPGASGAAFLRTTIGNAAVLRQEIIDRVEKSRISKGKAWRDLPMNETAPGHYELELSLLEVGRFEAKAYLLTSDGSLLWPEGDGNTVIKVEPAIAVGENSVYKVFPRLFGDAVSTPSPAEMPVVESLDKKGWAAIPPSGTFRDVARKLDHIIDDLGFRILLLLPPFPTPTTYARMGRYGSPYASTDFLEVDPALAEFDQSATPMDQFCELVHATHERGARLFIDLPVNHSGWASRMQTLHPEWFEKDADGKFHSPGAWGVVWEDLVELDFKQRALWEEVARIFLYWCRRGVDGFRCDAGYMVPEPVWTYVIARVRQEFPATCFFLEGLGGKKSVMESLLDNANLDWAYSELFQTYSRHEFDHYLPECERVSVQKGLQVHFTETHDNNRLAATSVDWAKHRTALLALLSRRGGWGITCGVEWLATEKISVHGRSDINWDAEENLIDWITQLNDLLAEHPALGEPGELTSIPQNENVLAVRRRCGDDALLILVNLDSTHAQTVHWGLDAFPGSMWNDLLTGEVCTPTVKNGVSTRVLKPLEIICLDAGMGEPATGHPPRQQREKEAAARAATFLKIDIDPAAFATDPVAACRLASTYAPVIHWRAGHDQHRIVTVPLGHIVLLESAEPFFYRIENADGFVCSSDFSLAGDGGHWHVFHPQQKPGRYALILEGQPPAWLEVPPAAMPEFPTTLDHDKAIGYDSYALLTNGRGAMSHVRAAFGEVRSQYDAFLAANTSDDFPADRQILFTRCRAWVRFRGHWNELNRDTLIGFTNHGDSVEWKFRIWLGSENQIILKAVLELAEGRNAVRLRFSREDDGGLPIELIVRPDVENRNFHEKTVAWDADVTSHADGFDFQLGNGKALHVRLPGASYQPEPEWLSVSHPVDAERGLGNVSQTFGPGHFTMLLESASHSDLFAYTNDHAGPWLDTHATEAAGTTEFHLARAIRDFVVKRDQSRTVIAGYPWFLDWGRDTLICLRGMLAAGMVEETRDILCQFGKFEQGGTLPNMIRGDDDSNRDTSDAPLWYVVICSDLTKLIGLDTLDTDCGNGRSIREVAISIVRGYAKGTKNGIYVDAASGLVFSPSHYTWMDTNHPAGTPREGYPIEIQALWIGALDFVAGIDSDNRWPELAIRARASIREYFWKPELGYLSDCLHCAPGSSAVNAAADDHLRSNQLLAITLGILHDWDRDDLAKILEASAELLVPGGIRSLADRPVTHHLPVYRDGQLLNLPDAPYAGFYTGDEDTRRKPAYHNGTVWTWPFPSYPEALFQVYGEDARAAALAYLHGSHPLFEKGCLGHLPEIIDGNAPHKQKGCGAQAWGVTEWLRVFSLLQTD